jgi:hypothetical protein
MKYIVTEQQLTNTVKRLNKEKAHRGKLSDVIEELVLSHFKRPVCDVAAMYIHGYDNYIVLILTPDYYGDATTTEITSNIENYIGVGANVIIKQSQDCEDYDSENQ